MDVVPGDWVLGDDNGVIVLSMQEAAAVPEQSLASDAAEPNCWHGSPQENRSRRCWRTDLRVH